VVREGEREREQERTKTNKSFLLPLSKKKGCSTLTGRRKKNYPSWVEDAIAIPRNSKTTRENEEKKTLSILLFFFVGLDKFTKYGK
jgi:hypothetical protein